MQTIKTGVVVALLLVVSYGAYVALNAPEPALPPELADWANEEAELDSLMNIEIPQQSLISATEVPVNSQNNLAASSLELPTLTSASNVPQGASTTNTGLTNIPELDGPAVALPGANTQLTQQPFANQQPVVQTQSQATGFSPPPMLGSSGTVVPPSNPSVSSSDSFPSIPLPSTSLASTTVLTNSSGSNSLPSTTVNPNVGNGSTPQAQQTQAPPVQPTLPFDTAREQALQAAGDGKLTDAMRIMMPYYTSPELTHSQFTDLTDMLDALAREVIYSGKRHLLLPPHIVKTGETLFTVAERYQVTPEILANINGLGDSKALVVGSQLKVIQGPFRGDIDLTRGELTMFLGDLYAGRFPISVGQDPAPRAGKFEVVEKRRDRTYYGAGGRVIAADEPRNPYGGYWIDLGQNICLHGTPEMPSADMANAGCISLSPIDAADAYLMLTPGSHIEIH